MSPDDLDAAVALVTEEATPNNFIPMVKLLQSLVPLPLLDATPHVGRIYREKGWADHIPESARKFA